MHTDATPIVEAQSNRTEALAWLVGRLHWEQTLSDLRTRHEAGGAPVDLLASTTAETHARAA